MNFEFEKILKDAMEPEETTPAELSQAVLQQVKEAKHMKKVNRTKVIKAAAIAGTIVLASGGVAYASSSIWYPTVAKRFGVSGDIKAQHQLEKDGFADVVEKNTDAALQSSATDKNIEISVEQVVSDQNEAQVYFKATFGEEYTPVEKAATAVYEDKEKKDDWRIQYFVEKSRVTYQGKEVSCSIDAVDVIDEHTVLYCCRVKLDGIVVNAEKNAIEIGISSFGEWNEETMKTDTVIAGDWTVAYEASCGTKVRIYTLNKKVKILDAVVTLEKIEVTPVSYKLYVKNDEGWNKIWSKDGIVEMDEEYNTIKDKEGNIPILEMVTNTEELDRRLDEIEEKKIYGDKIIRSFLLTSAFFLDENGQNLNDGGGCRLEDEKDPAYGIIDGNWYAGSTYEQICNLHKMRFAGQIVDISGCDYQEVVTVEE